MQAVVHTLWHCATLLGKGGMVTHTLQAANGSMLPLLGWQWLHAPHFVENTSQPCVPLICILAVCCGTVWRHIQGRTAKGLLLFACLSACNSVLVFSGYVHALLCG